MEIRCRCSKCEAKFKAEVASAGHKITCPRCGGMVMVPPMAQAIEDPTSEMVPQSRTAAPSAPATSAPPVAPPLEAAPPGSPWPLRIGLGVLGFVAIAAMLFTVHLMQKPERPTAVMIHWPVADRKDGGFLEVSGKHVEMTKKDLVVVHVAAGPHRVTLRRKGYEPVEWKFSLIKGEQKELTPEWKPAGEIARGK